MAQPPSLPVSGLAPGLWVLHNRNRLLTQLGRGGMGVVWLAVDEELSDKRALKFIPDIVIGDREEMESLKGEALRSQQLTHKHIVRTYDFVRDSRHAAISMEFMDGPSLKEAKAAADNSYFQPAEIATWCSQLCEALDYAHREAGIVHHDLKPANLLLDRTGETLKVSDFGIAQAMAETLSRVSMQATQSSGTPAYMSPQQAMGAPSMATDDIYALGATLHDLLSGSPPFYRGNVLAQVMQRPAPTIAETRAERGLAGEDIPAHWQEAITACLDKQPENRPRDITEVRQRLGLTGDLPTPALPKRALLERDAEWEEANVATVELTRPDTGIDPHPADVPPRATDTFQSTAGDADEPVDRDRGWKPKSKPRLRFAAVFVLLALLAAAVVFGLRRYSPNEEIRRRLDKVSAAIVSHDYAGAASAASGVIEKFPDDPRAYRLRGLARLRNGEASAAAADLDMAIQLDGEFAEAYLNRAECCLKARRFREAVKDADTAIRIRPEDPMGYLHRGRANHFLGLYPPAIEDFNKAIELNPNIRLGQFYRKETLQAIRRSEAHPTAPRKKRPGWFQGLFGPKKDDKGNRPPRNP